MKKHFVMVLIFLALLAGTHNALAQKGLYIGAGLGHAGIGGEVGDTYDGGNALIINAGLILHL
jgi:hypothetical protein